ncbi:uncharacterized protein LOC129877557 [Solanum dulcamara]|uniref:uncharacterized protein LOC129877557 n=1 Tax=Solanum dulcamara TaxID=45834 RepID=UPI0024852A96|nr:uncharacterized protein LOC129877557 [Solanum dulcamara]
MLNRRSQFVQKKKIHGIGSCHRNTWPMRICGMTMILSPKASSKEHRDLFRKIFGFDIDFYPGDAKAAIYITYLDFEKETDLLMELANHAIQDYNNKETSVYKYSVSYVETVSFILPNVVNFS